MGERDERTGVSRERANAAYVAARANRDVWPRNEKTGCVGMGDERNGAELLREAARLMRGRADSATPGPWAVVHYGGGEQSPGAWVTWHSSIAGSVDVAYCDSDEAGARYRPNAEHLSSWHPGVALTVAAWLERAAEVYTRHDFDSIRATAVARAYLSAPVSAGEPKENT